MKAKIFYLAMALVLVFSLATMVACVGGEPAPFSMQVIPEHMEDTIAWQSCVFLVVVADEGEGSGKGEVVSISATAPGSAVTVDPQAITPGQVAEVTVIPFEASARVMLTVTVIPFEERAGETLTVTIVGERDGLKQTETVYVTVWGEDGMALLAAEIRDKFIPWLAANHPEFRITSETEWAGTVVRPGILGVMYYLFFSEDLEMGVRWHVSIPPHDWAEIYLRHRTTELSPSYGFKISSVDAQEEPQAVDPEPSVWR